MSLYFARLIEADSQKMYAVELIIDHLFAFMLTASKLTTLFLGVTLNIQIELGE